MTTLRQKQEALHPICFMDTVKCVVTVTSVDRNIRAASEMSFDFLWLFLFLWVNDFRYEQRLRHNDTVLDAPDLPVGMDPASPGLVPVAGRGLCVSAGTGSRTPVRLNSCMTDRCFYVSGKMCCDHAGCESGCDLELIKERSLLFDKIKKEHLESYAVHLKNYFTGRKLWCLKYVVTLIKIYFMARLLPRGNMSSFWKIILFLLFSNCYWI